EEVRPFAASEGVRVAAFGLVAEQLRPERGQALRIVGGKGDVVQPQHSPILFRFTRARPHPGGGSTHHPLRSTIPPQPIHVCADSGTPLRTAANEKGPARAAPFVETLFARSTLALATAPA